MARSIPAFSALALVLFSASSSSQAPSTDSNNHKTKPQPADCWEIHSLGTLGGTFSDATDVNDSGVVVGNSETEPRILDPADPPVPLLRAFISAPNGGAITEILTPGFFFGTAVAVNNVGQVVGSSTIGRSFPISYFTDPGGGNVQTTLAFADARDINNVGQTSWDINFPFFRSVIGPNEQPDFTGTDLIDVVVPAVEDPLNTPFESVALNDAGQVAVNAAGFAYRWSSFEGAMALTPDAQGSGATGMNEAGQVVGTLQSDGLTQAFVTKRHNTSLTLLGKPGDGNQPTGINGLGQIVGTRPVGSEVHGYVTPPILVQRSIDLDTLNEVTRDGWSKLRPVAINKRGQIAGTGSIDGHDRAFLLSPRSILAFVPDQNGKHAKCFRLP
jgi:uncharacterized membrane protein